MSAVVSLSSGVREAKAFVEKFLDDRQLRQEVAALGPKPEDRESALAELVAFAATRRFVFTAEEYETAAEDYTDTRYGAFEPAATCCCRSSPSSSSSLPRSYAYGE
jgi:hypothetical protein